MPEEPAPLGEPAVWEVAVDGHRLAEVRHRQIEDLGELDTAALVATLRSAGDAIEENHLDRPASEILDERAHSFDVADHTPSNVDRGE